MRPIAAAESWPVPPIHSAGELADWLEIPLPELDWFADRRSFEAKHCQGRLRHYHYRLLAKRFGRMRLIEAPKLRLKIIQRRILDEILERIPPHTVAHGFRRNRSIKTFATPHTGQQVVLRIDLEDFFPSISSAQVQALFRTVGYPRSVAALLTGLCTNTTPADVWETAGLANVVTLCSRAHRLYSRPHLPQGAPTSPALANLCAYRLDCRLSALAASASAIYTRYADDLAFSGSEEFARGVKRFQLHACTIAMEEGFSVHHRKTRIMRHGVRQHLAGIVVNEGLNIRRDDYDRLKAILTNCLRHGPESQNRSHLPDFRAHLLGRVSYIEMLNPTRGRRLRKLFEQIVWQ
jgi:retron-type reverse transcriptase